MRIARRADELAAEGRSEPAAGVLANNGRRAGGEARAAARRADVCDRHPGFGEALADGEISAGHVDVLGRARAGLVDAALASFDAHSDRLLDDARRQRVDEFARRCNQAARQASADAGVARQERQRRQRAVGRSVDPVTGLCITRIALDPLTDGMMWQTINAALAAARADYEQAGVEPPAWTQLAADVVARLITGGRGVDGRVPEVSVLVDFDTLRGDAQHAGIVCELVDGTPLPPASVRRLCCDADIIPVVVGGDGVPLDVGRARRLATADQRRALAAMYTHCAYPGCHVSFEHCRIHHVTDWTHGGHTDLDQLVPLCATHHHLVHEGGWTLTLDPDRTITLVRPDGQDPLPRPVDHPPAGHRRSGPGRTGTLRPPTRLGPRGSPDSAAAADQSDRATGRRIDCSLARDDSLAHRARPAPGIRSVRAAERDARPGGADRRGVGERGGEEAAGERVACAGRVGDTLHGRHLHGVGRPAGVAQEDRACDHA